MTVKDKKYEKREQDLRRNFEILENQRLFSPLIVEKAWNDIFDTISKMLNKYLNKTEAIGRDPDWVSAEYDFCLKIYEKFSKAIKKTSVDHYGRYLSEITWNEVKNKDNKQSPIITSFRIIFNKVLNDLKKEEIIHSIDVDNKFDVIKSKVVFDKAKINFLAVSYENVSYVLRNSLREITFNFKMGPFNENYKNQLRDLVINVLKSCQSPVSMKNLRISMIEGLNLDPGILIRDSEMDFDSEDYHSDKIEHEKWIKSGELDPGQIANLSVFAKDVYFKCFSNFLKQTGSKKEIWRYVLYHKIGDDWKGIHVVEGINRNYGFHVISSATLTQWLTGKLNLDDADKNINEAIMSDYGLNEQLESAASNLSDSIKIETAKELGLKLPDTICADIQEKINKTSGLN